MGFPQAKDMFTLSLFVPFPQITPSLFIARPVPSSWEELEKGSKELIRP